MLELERYKANKIIIDPEGTKLIKFRNINITRADFRRSISE